MTFWMAALLGLLARDAIDQEAHPREQAPMDQASAQSCPADAAKSDFACDPHWAVKEIGVDRVDPALLHLEEPGSGVTVAHIDTGIFGLLDRVHPELQDVHFITADSQGNLLPLVFYKGNCPASEGCGPRAADARALPTDPLRRNGFVEFLELLQPGHGTGTASVLVSPPAGSVAGVAPGARVIPFHALGGGVLSQGRMIELSEAVEAAALLSDGVLSEGVDVVSISQGRRSPDPGLERAVRMAERHGIILVAASGEGPLWKSQVRFPAQYASVIAVSGTKPDGSPWDLFGAGRGRSATIAAPAYLVWRAQWEGGAGNAVPVVGRGKGTSFSTPLVSGAAALWIQRWGRQKLDATYGRSAVPAAFRYALTHWGFRTPSEMCDLAKSAMPAWPERTVKTFCEEAERRKTIWPAEKRSPDDHQEHELWGRGMLAVDLLLEGGLPDATAVCDDVYFRRGVEDWDGVCPQGCPGRGDADHVEALLRKPPFRPPKAKVTWVNGVSLLGHPFGEGPGWGAGPAVSVGVILSDHNYHSPAGPLVQVQIGHRLDVKAAVGYGAGFEYSPYGHNRSYEVGKFPGFGPNAGFGVKGAYMRASHENLVGAEAEISFYRIRLEWGYFWRVGSPAPGRPDTSGRWTWAFGLGY